ncbi:MAG: ectonucleotide pyrophosphatase/phosphodiesterase [Janthinobacterium lividum]
MPKLSLARFVLAGFALLSPYAPAQEHPAYGSAKPLPGLIVNTSEAPNSAHAMKQHYVVMVSLDGFRYDYPEEHGATHLQQLAQGGARAYNGMLPSYPSLTFPNHWTLVTGLFPEHHGIVRNSFYDPARKQRYKYTDPATSSDGSWYGGTPLWSLAEQQGMRSAVFMWPGSEAEVAGHRPSSYAKFEDQLDGHVGIAQIVTWLKLPAEQRPHFIAFYLPTTDHAGHWYGPDSVQETQAVHTVDDLMGELRSQLDATGLPVDLVVVADHGMIRNDNNWIQWDQFADLSHTEVVDWAMYPHSEAETAKVYREFLAHPDPRFSVYRQKDVPAYLHYSGNPRIGDPVLVPNGPYIAHLSATKPREDVGDHGYDPTRMTAMKALFVANGPDIRKGVSLPVFPNVDVYSFIARLLDLKPVANDGELGPLKQALKKH